jgi:hypothetical protein
MVEGRERSEWERTSFWCAMYANAHRDSKKRHKPYEASDFSPFQKEARKLTRQEKAENWSAMLARFKPKGS